VIFRIVDRDLFISILATFGISIMLQQIMNLIWGADIQTADSGLDSWTLMDGQIVIAQIKVLSFVLVFILGAALMLFLGRSKTGRAIRATAQNARAARIMGVNTDRVYATTYALNAAICGAAGALVLMTWIIHPFLGILYTVRSFLIVVVAGLGNLAGVVFAGLGLGALENYAGFILGAEFQVAFVYLLMIVILVWRNLVLRRKRQYLA
jgi:branched-chain amino acid transport system permease protein